MGEISAYSEAELKEIESFLQDSFIDVVNQNPGARSRKPDEAVVPEMERLRTSRSKGPKRKLEEKDFDELLDALDGPFGKQFDSVRQDQLRELEKVAKARLSEKAAPEERRTFAQRFAIYLIAEFCRKKPVATKTDGKVVITATALISAIQALGIPAIFAPVAIWLLTKARDMTVPALCKAATEHLAVGK